MGQVQKNDKLLADYIAFSNNAMMFSLIIRNITFLFIGEKVDKIVIFFNAFFWCIIPILGFGLILYTKRHISNSYLILLFLWIIIYIYSFFQEENIIVLFIYSAYFWIRNILMIYAGTNIKNIDILYLGFKKYNVIAVILMITQCLYFSKTNTYDMSYGYLMIIPLMLYFVEFLRKICVKSFIISFLIGLSVLLFGSRGALLCIVFSFALFVLLNFDIKKIMICIFSCLLFGIIFLIIFDKICFILETFFPESRTIHLITSGEILYMSGREKYYGYILKEFFDDPFRFRGLYADRVYLGEHLGVGIQRGTYAHNWILELIFQMGILGGVISFVIILLCILIIIELRKKNDKILKDLFAIFVGCWMGASMFSGSYLDSAFTSLFITIVLIGGKRIGIHWRKSCAL